MTTDDAALAPNWGTVLLVDAVVSLVLLAGGVALAVTWSLIVGSLLAAAGAANATALARRYRRWKRLRADAGLTR